MHVCSAFHWVLLPLLVSISRTPDLVGWGLSSVGPSVRPLSPVRLPPPPAIMTGAAHDVRDACGRASLRSSVAVAGVAAGVALHLVAVLHGAVVGHLDGLTDVGLPALQHLLLV